MPGKATAKSELDRQREQAEASANLPLKKGADPRTADVGPDYTYSKIRLHKKEEVNIYAAEQDARYALDPRLKKLIIVGILCVVVFVLACILPTQLYHRSQFNLALWLQETMAGVQNFIGVFTNPDTTYTTYVLTIFVSLLAGAAMALSGGVYQGALKNALASPSTLGVTNGGAIGAVVYAIFIYPNLATTNFMGSYDDLTELYANMTPVQTVLELFGGFLCSFIGCMAVVALIMLIAVIAGRGKVSNVALIVAGQVFASTITLVLSFIRMWMINNGDTVAATYLLQVQSMTFTGAYTPLNVLVFAVPLLACMAVCFVMSRKLSLLAFKEEEARSMGISTTRMRYLMVGVCTVMTALVISFCGMVGFLGLVVPYIARKLVGPDFRYLLPACALIGALLMTGVFYITQIGIPYLTSNSAGMLTSIIGCVTFLVIALRGRRSSGGEWL